MALRSLGRPLILAGIALALSLATTRGTGAGASFEFLFHADSAANDDQFFLNVAVGHYGYGRAELEPVLPRIRSVELDLPVVLFVAQESRRPVTEIVTLRERGLPWNDVFLKVGVPCERLFAGIDRDPGPPYGKAWGYWKNHPRDSRFGDDDIRSLVRLQVGGRVTGLSSYELARQQAGRPVAYVVVEKRGHGHKGHDEPPGQAKKQKDHGKGHGKGHEDEDHDHP